MPLSRTRRAEPTPPVLSLLSDFGPGSLYVGLLHAVIAGISPAARVIDLSHEVPPEDVLGGALSLADAIPYLPVGVHLAVVDPGVGSSRRALALRCGDGRILVGPDNGLLSLAAAAAGGVQTAVDIADSPLAAESVAATFHGRDIFAPVAAHLAAGANLLGAGDLVDPATLVELDLPAARVGTDALEVSVTAVDAFGNLALLATPAQARAAGLVEDGPVGIEVVSRDPDEPLDALRISGGLRRRRYGRWGRTFSDVAEGRLLLHEDSTGRLALAVNGASAAVLFDVEGGARLRLTR
ncbi:MAG TPA: SAM-dependent chlorinase/fluorinase [Solirubrobacteraceae bacterium]|nr:SAM-dependent chlorinase/fluorinase [Solirubrobacteraceae bacterium]